MVTPPTPSKSTRCWPTFSLRTFLLVTLALSLALGTFGRVWLKAWRDSQPPTLYELAQIAKRHGIPMPPKGAKLVLPRGGPGAHYANYSPGFLLSESDDRATVLLGVEQESADVMHREPPWKEFSLTAVPTRPYGANGVEFNNLSTLLCAVQLEERGDHQQAKLLFERFVSAMAEAERWTDSMMDDHPPEEPQRFRELVAFGAFDHLRNQLRVDVENWPAIRERMGSLFEEFPDLKNKVGDQLLADLAKTLDSPPPLPGSTEAVLMEWSLLPAAGSSEGGFFRHRSTDDNDEPARRIILSGFSAIPDLLRLADDRRLTTHRDGYHKLMRLGDLSMELLKELRVDDGESGTLQEAWQSAQDLGEQEFFVRALFGRKDQQIAWVQEGPARVLAEKYPEELEKACELFSQSAGRDTQPFALTDAIATARMPTQERIRILVAFAQRGSLAHKRCVLQTLAEVDQQKCAALLLPVLRELPTDTDHPYWTCPEARFTHVVMLLDDLAVWRAYLQAARRSSVGLQMEMMNPMDYAYIGERNRGARLAFLAKFLDEKSARDDSHDSAKFDGPCAAFTIHKIVVGDFAASQIASILGLPNSNADESWTPEQWSALREQVRERLKGEKLPELE